MLWLKAFHIIFVVTWFAGLFYLPRLFVYHVSAVDPISIDRFKIMERRLLGIMTLGGLLAGGFGLWLLSWHVGTLRAGPNWLHAKLLCVTGLVVFHLYCWHYVRQFRADINSRSERFFRLFNEVPALFLVVIVLLAVLRPYW